jgi:hypothetical protein
MRSAVASSSGKRVVILTSLLVLVSLAVVSPVLASSRLASASSSQRHGTKQACKYRRKHGLASRGKQRRRSCVAARRRPAANRGHAQPSTAPAAAASAGPTTSSPTALTPGSSGMPVGDVPGWHEVFADDFSTPEPVGSFSNCVTGLGLRNDYCSGLRGTPYFGTWFAYPDGWTGTPATGTYEPSQSVSVENGSLDYFLHSGSADGTTDHMIDAVVPKIPGGSPSGGLLYGRYIVRARWDALSSYHISFLLWPDSGTWPRDGEIDYPEANMASTDVSAFMHWQNASSGGQQDAYDVYTDPSQWHVYEIDWLPSSLSFYLDGQLVGRSTANIPDTPMHWVLQTNTSSSLRAGDTEAGHVQIDWAVAYVPAS